MGDAVVSSPLCETEVGNTVQKILGIFRIYWIDLFFVGVWRSGSALALGARGRRFDPCHPDQDRIPTKTQLLAGSLNLRFLNY